MSELALIRSPEDRHRFDLAGVGALHVPGPFGGENATLETAGGTWTCKRAGLLGGALTATGPEGAVDGRFAPAFLGNGGRFLWREVEYDLRPVGLFTTGFRLQRDGVTLWEFRLQVMLGGARPLDATRMAPDVPDEVVMFAIFIARVLARRKRRRRSDGVAAG